MADAEVGQWRRHCPRAVAQRLPTCLLRMLHDTLADCVSHRSDYRRNCYRYHYLTGQFVRDLVSWHGGTFKSGHDSFCPMKTGIASVFCETWLPTPGARQTSASGRSQVSQIRTKREIRQYPSNRESLFESDHADEALASI